MGDGIAVAAGRVTMGKVVGDDEIASEEGDWAGSDGSDSD